MKYFIDLLMFLVLTLGWIVIDSIINWIFHKKSKVNNMNETDLIYRLRKRAEIRRQITTRKSVQENKPDRIADLLEEAALEIERLQEELLNSDSIQG